MSMEIELTSHIGNSAGLGTGWNLYAANGLAIDCCPFGAVTVTFSCETASGMDGELAQSQYGMRNVTAASLYF